MAGMNLSPSAVSCKGNFTALKRKTTKQGEAEMEKPRTAEEMLLTAKETARILGIPRETLRFLGEIGVLKPFSTVGGLALYRIESVLARI